MILSFGPPSLTAYCRQLRTSGILIGTEVENRIASDEYWTLTISIFDFKIRKIRFKSGSFASRPFKCLRRPGLCLYRPPVILSSSHTTQLHIRKETPCWEMEVFYCFYFPGLKRCYDENFESFRIKRFWRKSFL